MQIEESVSQWIAGLEAGDDDSAQRLWERYFERLRRLAQRKLPRHVKREFDEEDVALSAFNSLCTGIAERRFPDLNDRCNLWALLIVITARKVRRRLRDAGALKRGGGSVRGESVFDGDDRGLQEIMGREPTPEFVAEVAEESERLMDFLEDESLRRIALLKLEGHANAEIAARMGCGLRTIERRVGLIRKLWVARTGSDDGTR